MRHEKKTNLLSFLPSQKSLAGRFWEAYLLISILTWTTIDEPLRALTVARRIFRLADWKFHYGQVLVGEKLSQFFVQIWFLSVLDS